MSNDSTIHLNSLNHSFKLDKWQTTKPIQFYFETKPNPAPKQFSVLKLVASIRGWQFSFAVIYIVKVSDYPHKQLLVYISLLLRL